MQDAPLVGTPDASPESHPHSSRTSRGDRANPINKPFGKRWTGAKLLCDVKDRTVESRFEDLQDVQMIEQRRGLRFLHKSATHRSRNDVLWARQLDRDVPSQKRILCREDDSVPAASQLVQDLEASHLE